MPAEHLIIEAGRTEKHYWRDIWRFRELFAFLAWRDILVRYKQTVIGVLWALLRPLIAMVVFTVIFGLVAGFAKEEDGPYMIVVFAAVLPWNFFAAALADCSNSLVMNANLISKIYFPRIIVPCSSVVVSLVDFVISFSILLGLMAFYQFAPSIRFLMLPVFLLLASAAAMGLGIWLAALNVRFRDFRIIVPFIVQFGFFVSPVGFKTQKIVDFLEGKPFADLFLFLYTLNPMVGVIDGFRWAILNDDQIYWPGMLVSIILTAILLLTGIAYFRKTEKTFADVI
jgi:lipopolysaccharide transport system permease protein